MYLACMRAKRVFPSLLTIPVYARDARFFRHMGHLDRKRENGFAMDSGAENEKGPQPHHVTLLS